MISVSVALARLGGLAAGVGVLVGVAAVIHRLLRRESSWLYELIYGVRAPREIGAPCPKLVGMVESGQLKPSFATADVTDFTAVKELFDLVVDYGRFYAIISR